MYSNKLVVCVKVNGKVLRENGNTVSLPFGSEYEIFLKNLNSVRVRASVSIDGKDIGDGTQFIIPVNGSVSLERFLKNGNRDRGNKFKFIERTRAVEEYRGIEAEDGVIRVEYWTEKVVRQVEHVEHITKHVYHDYWYWPTPYFYPLYPRPYFDGPHWVINGSLQGGGIGSSSTSGGSLESTAHTSGLMRSSGSLQNGQNEMKVAAMNCNMTRDSLKQAEMVPSSIPNEAGITVPGSQSDQKFYQGAYFPVENYSDVIVLNLRGEVGGKEVKAPVTVSRKAKCQTCGKIAKSNSQFCSRCGTALEII